MGFAQCETEVLGMESNGVPCITNISGAAAAVEGIRAMSRDEAPVARIRQYQVAPVG